MTDTLLIIAISLLGVLLVLVVILLIKKTKPATSGIQKDELRQLLEDTRINSIKDMQTSIAEQNREIQVLKDAITAGMSEAKSTNQTALFEFLEGTRNRLTELQTNFTKESAEVKDKNKDSIQELIKETSREVQALKTSIVKEISETNDKNNANLNERNIKTQEHIQSQITTLKDQVQLSLQEGFKKNDEAIQDFIKKTATIEASTQKLEELRKEINQFNNILSNQKTRGNFGEDILEQIFVSIFGADQNNIFYRSQVNLTKEFKLKQTSSEDNVKQDVIVDFVFNAETDHGTLPLSIDAKFPYTNYLPLLDDTISAESKKEARKLFKSDVIKRIREVEKYIIDGHTAPYAVMFVPAEAVFIDIFKEFPEVVDEARRRRIIIASPSLIVTILQMLKFILKDYQKRNNADNILALIDDVGQQLLLFAARWDDHKKLIARLQDSTLKLDTTTGKMKILFDIARDHNANKAFAEAKPEETDKPESKS